MTTASPGALLRHLRQVVTPFDPRDDRELLADFAARRDHAAFAVLVRRHGSLVLNVCRRVLHHEQDAEDAFQATFLVLAAKAGSVPANTAVAAYLHGIAYRLALKVRREAARRRRRESHAQAPATPDVATELSWREVQSVLEEEVQRLPEKYRTPFVLCCLEGVSRAEAGRQMGVKEGTVWSRLSEARARLQQRLSRRGIALAAVLGAMAVAENTVRAELRDTVVRGATGSLPNGVPPRVALLVQAGLQTMAGKMKLALIGFAALLAVGAGSVVCQALTSQPLEPPPAILQAKTVAEAKKPDAPQVLLDRHGDPLPPGAIARLGTVRWRHGFGVYSLAYSPDGKMIAASGTGRAITLWDAVTGKELHQFPSHSQPIGVAFSLDGSVLATTHNSACHLWDISTGKERHRLVGQSNPARAIAFSSDGKTVAAACFDGKVLLWDSATGTFIRRFNDSDGEPRAITFSPDGRLLALAGTGRTIRLWNPNTGKELRRLIGHKDRISGIAFSPDGKLLASTSLDETLCLWDPMTGRRVRVLSEKSGAYSLAFSRDGKRLTSGHQDGTIRVWDPATGEEKHRWRGYPNAVMCVAFSPDGKTLISGGVTDSAVRFWSVSTGKEWEPFEGHHGGVDGLGFAPDGRTLISIGRDEQMMEWDLQTRKLRRRFAWQSWGRGVFALSADGNTLVAGGSHDKEVRVWDTRSDKPGRLLGKHEDRLWAIAVSPDGRLAASGGLESTIRLWDTASGKEVRTLKGFTDYPFCLAFSPDGKRLACGLRRRNQSTHPTIRLWDVSSGKEICRIESRSDLIGMGLAFSPDGKLLASGHEWANEAYVCLWDCSTGKELCRHRGHRDTVWRVAFSADGKRIASGSAGFTDNSIHVWEAATGRLIRRFEVPHSGAASLAFSSDGRTLATGGGDSTILLWDLQGPRKAALTPHELDACWVVLKDADATKAYDAVWSLVAAPKQAVPFLRRHLRPVSRPDAAVVERLLADLDSDDFTVRQRAADELSKLGDAIIPDLQRALAKRPALEVRRRIQQQLDQTQDCTAERLRDHRAIQALEHLGSPQAKELLETLAGGAPDARRTEEAKTALRRMAR